MAPITSDCAHLGLWGTRCDRLYFDELSLERGEGTLVINSCHQHLSSTASPETVIMAVLITVLDVYDLEQVRTEI